MKIFKKLGLILMTLSLAVVTLILPSQKEVKAAASNVPVSQPAIGPAAGLRRVYLEPQGWFTGARYAMWTWGGTDQWIDFHLNENITGVYWADVPEINTGFLVGRFDKNNLTNSWSNPPLYNQTSDLTLADRFEKLTIIKDGVVSAPVDMSFFVTLESDGGDISQPSATLTSGTSLATLDTDYIPVRGNDIFVGWAYANGTPAKNHKIYSDLTLKAIWSAVPPLNVKFYDGTKLLDSQIVAFGEHAVEPTDPVKAGYKFDGWFIGVEEYDFASAVEEDLDITAKWSYVGIATNTRVRIYFENSSNWAEVKVFAWPTAGTPYTVDWPGNLANQLSDNLFYYDLPVGANVIFNDGLDVGDRYQTNDAVVPANGNNILILVGDSVLTNGAYKYNFEWVKTLPTTVNYNLDVKFQYGSTAEDRLDLRLISTLGAEEDESLDLGLIDEVGFVVLDANSNKSVTLHTTSVYSEVVVNETTVSAQALGAIYFFAFVINNIPADEVLVVTPYVVLNDGTYVFGVTKTFVVIPNV